LEVSLPLKRIYAKEEVCIGCRLCEIHCAVAHSQYKDNIVKAFKRQKHRPVPRVIVEESGPLSFAVQCRHCDEPECAKACITGAMCKDPKSGLVLNDSERCVGCWTCIAACPYGAIRRDETEGKVAAKCDMCRDNPGEVPACVANCPNEALVYKEEDPAVPKVAVNSG